MQTPGTPHGPQPRKPPRKQSREPARPADGRRDLSVGWPTRDLGSPGREDKRMFNGGSSLNSGEQGGKIWRTGSQKHFP